MGKKAKSIGIGYQLFRLINDAWNETGPSRLTLFKQHLLEKVLTTFPNNNEVANRVCGLKVRTNSYRARGGKDYPKLLLRDVLEQLGFNNTLNFPLVKLHFQTINFSGTVHPSKFKISNCRFACNVLPEDLRKKIIGANNRSKFNFYSKSNDNGLPQLQQPKLESFFAKIALPPRPAAAPVLVEPAAAPELVIAMDLEEKIEPASDSSDLPPSLFDGNDKIVSTDSDDSMRGPPRSRSSSSDLSDLVGPSEKSSSSSSFANLFSKGVRPSGLFSDGRKRKRLNPISHTKPIGDFISASSLFNQRPVAPLSPLRVGNKRRRSEANSFVYTSSLFNQRPDAPLSSQRPKQLEQDNLRTPKRARLEKVGKENSPMQLRV